MLIASFFHFYYFVLCPWGENPVFQYVSRPTRISPKEIESHFYSRRLFCPHITPPSPPESRLSQSVVQLKDHHHHRHNHHHRRSDPHEYRLKLWAAAFYSLLALPCDICLTGLTRDLSLCLGLKAPIFRQETRNSIHTLSGSLWTGKKEKG